MVFFDLIDVCYLVIGGLLGAIVNEIVRSFEDE